MTKKVQFLMEIQVSGQEDNHVISDTLKEWAVNLQPMKIENGVVIESFKIVESLSIFYNKEK